MEKNATVQECATIPDFAAAHQREQAAKFDAADDEDIRAYSIILPDCLEVAW